MNFFPISQFINLSPGARKEIAEAAIKKLPWFKKVAEGALKQFGAEATEEFTTSFIQNCINEAIYGNEIETKGFWGFIGDNTKDSLYSAAVGGAYGAATGAVASGRTARAEREAAVINNLVNFAQTEGTKQQIQKAGEALETMRKNRAETKYKDL